MVVNDGYALLLTSTMAKALLVRISDGASWDIATAPGFLFGEAIWVDRDELWIVGGSPLANPGDLYTDRFYRFSLSALGAPTRGPI